MLDRIWIQYSNDHASSLDNVRHWGLPPRFAGDGWAESGGVVSTIMQGLPGQSIGLGSRAHY